MSKVRAIIPPHTIIVTTPLQTFEKGKEYPGCLGFRLKDRAVWIFVRSLVKCFETRLEAATSHATELKQ